jgi:molybdate transport system permease protein
MLGYLVGPMLSLLGALPMADASAYFGEGALPALMVTLFAATAATLIAGLFGLPLGLWLARTDSGLRHAVTVAVLIPLAIPPVVGGLSLLLWLGSHGWLGGWLERLGLVPVDRLAGTVLAQTFVASPYVILSARAAFSSVDRNLEDAARTLRCTPFQTLVRVTVPTARLGLATGLVLGWVRCLGEFGATAVVAYHPYTLPILTYVRLTGEGLSSAISAGLLLALVGALAAGTMLWLDARQVRRAERHPIEHGELGEATPLSWIPSIDAASRAQPIAVTAALALDDFRLDVSFEAPARFVALLGPSGAGKSLTLKTIAGLVKPDSGRVSLGSRLLIDTATGIDIPAEHRHIGYVAQRGALFDHLDVEGNIDFALERLPPSSRKKRIDELIKSFGLERFRRAHPETLSGGERQRVALARALAPGSSALLLDEPFASLDTPVRHELRDLLREVHQRTGVPVLLVTHDRADALGVADHVIIIDRGRVVQAGSVEEVFARPKTLSVARLLGIANVLTVHSLKPATAGCVRASTDWGDILIAAPEHSGRSWMLAVPASAVQLEPGGVGCHIVSCRRSGNGWRVRLGLAAGQPLEAFVPHARLRGWPSTNADCRVAIDPLQCHLLKADQPALLADDATTVPGDISEELRQSRA